MLLFTLGGAIVFVFGGTVFRTVTVCRYLLLFNFLHDLIKTEVAEDKTGLGRVQGWDIPGPAATILLSLVPGALQLTIRLCVVSKKL